MFTLLIPHVYLSLLSNLTSKEIDVTGAVLQSLDSGLLTPDELDDAMASIGRPFKPRYVQWFPRHFEK